MGVLVVIFPGRSMTMPQRAELLAAAAICGLNVVEMSCDLTSLTDWKSRLLDGANIALHDLVDGGLVAVLSMR